MMRSPDKLESGQRPLLHVAPSNMATPSSPVKQVAKKHKKMRKKKMRKRKEKREGKKKDPKDCKKCRGDQVLWVYVEVIEDEMKMKDLQARLSLHCPLQLGDTLVACSMFNPA